MLRTFNRISCSFTVMTGLLLIFGTVMPVAIDAAWAGFGKDDEKTNELYADQPDEKFAPADPRLPNTVRRARAEDTIFKISNPREEQVKDGKAGTRKALVIDYEVVRLGKFEGGEIVVHTSDGRRQNIGFNLPDRREHGKIELVIGGNTPKSTTAPLPKNAEFYIIRADKRFGPNGPIFKVSNSVVLGKMSVLTKARSWTAKEIAAYQKGPSVASQPNINKDVGEDTEFVGGRPDAFLLRFANPDLPLIGLEYRMGVWFGDKCLNGLVPIYERDQENFMQNSMREVAKKGYVVAGAEVQADKRVNGIKLIYGKLKDDGTVDLTETYTGPLLGFKGATTKTLAKDGRKVLGIHIRQAAVLDSFALVADKK